MERIIQISTVCSRAGICRAKVWDGWQMKTAMAKAGGGGYDRESAAVADGLNVLGVRLGAVSSFGWDIDRGQFVAGGVGMWSILDALRIDGFTVYEEHPTNSVAVYICVK